MRFLHPVVVVEIGDEPAVGAIGEYGAQGAAVRRPMDAAVPQGGRVAEIEHGDRVLRRTSREHGIDHRGLAPDYVDPDQNLEPRHTDLLKDGRRSPEQRRPAQRRDDHGGVEGLLDRLADMKRGHRRQHGAGRVP